ncbi:MAG: Cas9 inhibitor AcrIIA9 family protein [Candidatus Izemoplasmatales bacterium]|nr:Cas9 inhibitor AcrIIA9 family protein [Candidatus Izemoplasmatales bacterium]
MNLNEQMKKTDNIAIHRIGMFLEKKSLEDQELATCLEKETKTLQECWMYICNQFLKTSIETNDGCRTNGADDEVVFGMAIEYYKNGDIEMSPIKNVVTEINLSPAKNKEVKKEKRNKTKVQLEQGGLF